MALNPFPIGQNIASIIKLAASTVPPNTRITDSTLTKMWQDIMTAIYNDTKASAQVTVAVASVSGVTTGPSASGPGAGTGTIS